MAAAMISDRGLRKKITQEAVKEVHKAPPKKASKRKSASTPKPQKPITENNNNNSKKPKIVPNGDGKEDLFAAYQPWVIQAYGDLAKTKTITLRKYSRILKALRGEDLHSSDSSKFRFWVKAKGFHLGQPSGYDAKPADGIVCRYSALDVDGGQEAIDRCSGSAGDPALYVPTAPVKNAAYQDPVYRKVAIVENFFDIIYTVHVDLEGRAGKHAGQKRTYRTITETYAFLPREAVTRFLMGCLDCQRRPRSLSPASVLPTPSPSPTPLSSTIIPNGFHQLAPLAAKLTDLQKPIKNCSNEVSTKNWESEIDASQPSIKISFTDGLSAFDTSGERSLRYLNPSQDIYAERNGIDLPSAMHVDYAVSNSFSPNNIGLFDSGVSAFRSVRKESISGAVKEDTLDLTKPELEEPLIDAVKVEPVNFDLKSIADASVHKSTETKEIVVESSNGINKDCLKEDGVKKEDTNFNGKTKKKHHKEVPRKPYNPLDVCNLTSKDPPKSRSPPKKRLNPIFNKNEVNVDDSKSFSKPWSPSMQSMFSPHRLTESLGGSQKPFMEIDYSVPITTTYLKHMRSLGYSTEESMRISNKESLNQDQSEITDDEHFSGEQLKDADKVKLLLLAWNLQTQKKAGDMAANKRTSLSISDKIEIIRALERGKKNAAVCRQFDLSSSTVSTLWKNRRTIVAALKNSTATRKKMRNCSAAEVDRALLRWFRARRDAGLPVSGPVLTIQAEKLAERLGEENFSCNNGWLDRFKRRHGIVYSDLTKSRNGDGDGGAGGGGGGGGDTNMADLWASYHSALGLAGAGASAGAARRRDQPSPVLLGTGSEGPGGAHDETSSSAGNGKEDEDTLASDDESDDRLDPQHHDPERLKAFNMFVRLFVDENLDRMVPISKQPKEKIQAIIDSCTRQFPEFAERARKRIRTYLKSCRRNKKVRDGNASAGTATPAWDATIRPTPAHLTSVQAEQILAQACENESHNAKRMRLGLEPVSQPMPTTAASMSMDTTAPTVPHTGLLGVYGGGGKGAPQDSPAAPAPPSLLASLHNGGCHTGNNNAVKGEGGGSKSASPASSPALPLFRANFPQSFGQHQQGRQSSRTSTPSASVSATDFTSSLASSHLGFGHAGLSGAPAANALLSTLGAVAGLHGPGGAGGSGSATNAAVAAYQSALFSAAMAHQGQGLNFGGLGVALAGNGPTDLSMKNTSTLSSAFPASLSSATAASALGLTPPSSSISHTGQNSTKPLLLSHKLNTAEMAAVRQLITGYRESAAFLLRSADELETLLLQQP